ncbi:MAG: hypothetical protein ACAI35_15535 [Candidatus Methylacidiphilales bacterium]|nr:hypothetical protein [Candidatus Methylacidiphilales bacterium]
MTRFQAGVVAFWVIVIGILTYQWVTWPVPKPNPEIIAKKFATRNYEPPPKLIKPKINFEEYEILDETPDVYHFRFKFKVHNVGEIPVRNVSIRVMPYRYGYIGTEDGERIQKSDPNYEISEFVKIPSLKPGESRDYQIEFRKIENYVPAAQIDFANLKFEVDTPAPAPAAATATPAAAKP